MCGTWRVWLGASQALACGRSYDLHLIATTPGTFRARECNHPCADDFVVTPWHHFTRVPDRAARSRGRDHQACCSFCSHGADAAAVGQTGVGPLWRAVVRTAVTTQVVRVDALRL
ncbi:MAG: hypothetical protein ACK53Y_04490, partial [bacterium]